MISQRQLDESIIRTLYFLKSKQNSDGLWRDFETLAGASSDWVSGFVSTVVLLADDPLEMTDKAINSLASRQRLNGGWSYNSIVPTDCDSTSWVLLALSTAPNLNENIIHKGIRYIISHQNKISGGFSTYCPDDGIHEFIQAPSIDIMEGWFDVHSCVTCVAIQTLVENGLPIDSDIILNALTYLDTQRNNSGLWDSYWWKGYAYSTYHALRAIHMCRKLTNEKVKEIGKLIISRQNNDGGWNDNFGKKSEIFCTAFLILSLLLYQNDETLRTVERGIDWIIGQQKPDGSFPSTLILKIPPPMVKDPDIIRDWKPNQLGTRVIIEDKERVFTSSAALWALISYKSLM